jgi:hypothetical protein
MIGATNGPSEGAVHPDHQVRDDDPVRSSSTLMESGSYGALCK